MGIRSIQRLGGDRMKTTVAAIVAVSAAYLAVADEMPGIQPLAEEVNAAVVDPVSGKVWDRQSREWVPFHEFAARTKQRGTVYIEQVPFVPPVITNGLDVLAKREDAARRHWDHVLYLQDVTNSPLRFR